MLFYRGQLHPQNVMVVVIDQVKAKARWSFCLAVFCFVLCAALVVVLCIDAYYGGGFLCTYAFVHNGGSAVFCSSTREFNCSDRR